MKSFVIFTTVVLLVIFSVGLSKVLDKGEAKGIDSDSSMPSPVLRIGHCPTMKPLAQKLSQLENVVLKEVPSAGIALKNLNQGSMDFILVGRKARKDEVSPGIKEIQLDPEATTLVTNEYRSILLEDLDNALSNDNSISLIKWADLDYSKEDLLVVVDPLGNKIEKYRTPFVYYREYFENGII